MTTLVVEPLKDELSQTIKYKLDYRSQLAGIYPYLYMHNAPAGVFTFSIIRDGQIIYTELFTSSNIKSKLGTIHNYAHVFYPSVPPAPVMLEKGEYTLRITATAYVYDTSSFLGWVRQHEDLNNEIESVAENNANPLAYRYKTYKASHL